MGEDAPLGLRMGRWLSAGVALDFAGSLLLLGSIEIVAPSAELIRHVVLGVAVPGPVVLAVHMLILPVLTGLRRWPRREVAVLRSAAVAVVGLVAAVPVGFVAGFLAAFLCAGMASLARGGSPESSALPLAAGVLLGVMAGGATVGFTGSCLRDKPDRRLWRDLAGGIVAALIAALGSVVLLGRAGDTTGWDWRWTVGQAALDALALLPHLLLIRAGRHTLSQLPR